METIVVKDGSTVYWRGSWGTDLPKLAKVEGIERTVNEHEKDGKPVESVNWVDGEWEFPFVCGLDNGHWAYSYQLEPLGNTDD